MHTAAALKFTFSSRNAGSDDMSLHKASLFTLAAKTFIKQEFVAQYELLFIKSVQTAVGKMTGCVYLDSRTPGKMITN